MTDKSKRQRGSRTHGGGTHKNRRGAGHRGGRGDAGRDKHEQHLHPPIGKSGFTRPEKTQEDIAEIDVRQLDENAALMAADGIAEEDGDGYRIDAREVVEDGFDVDAVKVLGAGQVRNELTVVADAFSAGAREKIGAAGGTATLSERGEQRQADKDDADDTE
ncbi:uL15m family ribosomal protein [Halorhabdus salina]|uniref:uL15m family ribosomal protein n=1 Tax=Halorhabdus salina TaxID=2750670 RepID=UPI0015EE7C54|nr:uL15m family ribosomal protein [Halorhabdus salina]